MSEITPERLRSLFSPRNVAIVGASDKNTFSRGAFRNLVDMEFDEHAFLVNPRNAVVHDRPTYPRIADIPEPIDVAFMMVPRAAMLESLTEAAQAGIRNAVILSSGYGETGPAGRQAQAELVTHAENLGLLILGPNHLGFANFVDQIPVTAVPALPRQAGAIALLSQSGASSNAMLEFAVMTGNDLSYLVTLGNEAMITAGHAIEFFVQDPATRSIAVFMETIREPAVFRRAALAAMAAGKALVVFKAGASEAAARAAIAHTGALVGDDRVVEAMFRELGIIRVRSIEDMMVTAGLAAAVGPVGEGGLGVISISGGACDIIADRAAAENVELAEFNDASKARLREVLPDFGTLQTPLDLTGAVMMEPSIFTRSLAAIDDDPGIAIVAAVATLPWAGEGPWHVQPLVNGIGAGIAQAKKPVVMVGQVLQPISERTKEVLRIGGIPVAIGGLNQAVAAFGGLLRWSRRRRELLGQPTSHEAVSAAGRVSSDRTGVWSENVAREVLATAGIPVVPAVLAQSAAEAVAAARDFGTAVVLKIASPDIAHKSDVGGVLLGITGADAVRSAYDTVRAAGAGVAGARVEGVLVSPMRSGGVELLVGAVRDATWGPMLAIALGGVFVEVLDDSALTPVPVTPQRVKTLLRTLKAFPLLEGTRGSAPADLDALARVISAVGDLVHALGDELESLEINPLRVSGAEIEALDALITWRQSPATAAN